jgi:NAD(P)-dependent dehydrogenase (short-subunit alcohol dehydrogenase family)
MTISRTIDLAGEVAVVTGGRGDIGSAVVTTLVAAGAKVAVADLRELPDPPADGTLHTRIDVSDAAAVTGWLDAVEAELGTPTLVIPAAAIATVGSVLELTAEQWRDELAVDLTGPFLLAADASRRMIAANRPGRIVLVGSWAGHAPHQHVPAYSVAKAGLRMLTQVLAMELAPHQILVNEIAIGVVDAGVSRTTFAKRPDLRAHSERIAPVRHLVEVDEIVTTVLDLCDPKRRSMTGSTVLLDGGMSLRTAFSDAGPGDDGAGS